MESSNVFFYSFGGYYLQGLSKSERERYVNYIKEFVEWFGSDYERNALLNMSSDGAVNTPVFDGFGYFVMEDAGQVVAIASLQQCRKINRIAVRPGCERKGFASTLLLKISAFYMHHFDEPDSLMYVWSPVSPDVVPLFEKVGWRPHPTLLPADDGSITYMISDFVPLHNRIRKLSPRVAFGAYVLLSVQFMKATNPFQGVIPG